MSSLLMKQKEYQSESSTKVSSAAGNTNCLASNAYAITQAVSRSCWTGRLLAF